jgi:hypothetical protein
MRRSRLLSPDALVLVVLLVLLAVFSFRLAGGGDSGEDPDRPRRSAASARPGGYKALFLLLRANNLPVVRVERQPREWPRDARLVITAQEYLPYLARTIGPGAAAAAAPIRAGHPMRTSGPSVRPRTPSIGWKGPTAAFC